MRYGVMRRHGETSESCERSWSENAPFWYTSINLTFWERQTYRAKKKISIRQGWGRRRRKDGMKRIFREVKLFLMSWYDGYVTSRFCQNP
jgi:hypothetical protein